MFLVTKDIFVRIKADILGITAQDFAEQVPEYDKQYREERKYIQPKRNLMIFIQKAI